MVNLTKFYGEGLKQLPPIRVESVEVKQAINSVQYRFLKAVNDLPRNTGMTEEEARDYCKAHGLVLREWIKSAKVIGCISRIDFPVMVMVFDASAGATGYVKYEGVHMGAFQIFQIERFSGRIKKDNSDDFLRTLFPDIEELKALNKDFQTLLYSYHSWELPEWGAKDCTGAPTQGCVLGIEPEVQINPAAIIDVRGVPLNKMGRVVTMCTHMEKQDPVLTLDCTVDMEFYIRPYGNLCGFRDNYLLLCQLFIVDESCGTHVHASIVNKDKTLKWTNQAKLTEAVKILFEDFEFTFEDKDTGKKKTVKGFIGYLNLFPEKVDEILGRLWGMWCGAYVGESDHSSAVNVATGNVEIRLPRIHDESQMIKVCEIVRAIAKAVDMLYDMQSIDYAGMFAGQKNQAEKAKAKKASDYRRAFKSLVTVWNKAMDNKLASDTNTKKKAGSRRRNID